MAIQVSWYNPEHTALHVELSGRFSLATVRGVQAAVYTHLEGTTHPVIIIYDYRQVDGLAIGFISDVRRELTYYAHPAASHTIHMGMNSLIRKILEVFQRWYPHLWAKRRLYFANTLSEADELLEQLVQQSRA